VDIFFGVFISYFFESFNLCKIFLKKISELGETGRSFCSGVNFMIWPIKLVNNSIKNSDLGGPNSYFNIFGIRTLQNSYGVE
jgi:hypothetical protein